MLFVTAQLITPSKIFPLPPLGAEAVRSSIWGRGEQEENTSVCKHSSGAWLEVGFRVCFKAPITERSGWNHRIIEIL